MSYTPDNNRYQNMAFRRCGYSGLKLPEVSLGLWHNFGTDDNQDNATSMIQTAFDLGITHFDLANNYGPVPGAAEENFGNILKAHFASYRDEMIISSKAGYEMWPGPYGDWGSRKYLMASIDQSLKRMQLDYVDIFYSHRYDANTPLLETMTALADIVKQGKAVYVGRSKYPTKALEDAITLLKQMNVPCLIYQDNYSMLNRNLEQAHLDLLENNHTGLITFGPLAQGLLSDKYLDGIPESSRAAGDSIFLNTDNITTDIIRKTTDLNEVAKQRKQTLAQMAIAWLLKDSRTTSVLIGASSSKQISENIGALDNVKFTDSELLSIDKILSSDRGLH